MEVCVGLATIVSALEMLARRRQLADTGLFSWPVLRTHCFWLQRSRLFDALCRYPNVLLLLCVRLVVGILLVVPVGFLIHGFAIGTALMGAMILMVRSPIGNDGADQMTTIVLVGAFGTHICAELGIEIALWFVALQTCLSYATSGLAKLRSREWRNGQGLVGVMRTEIFGNCYVLDVLESRHWIAIGASWGVILFESAYIAVLLLPFSVLVTLLAVSALFHLAAARIMGLNNFVLAFGATFPALCHCWARLHLNGSI
jgi:hypothetical protein